MATPEVKSGTGHSGPVEFGIVDSAAKAKIEKWIIDSVGPVTALPPWKPTFVPY